MRSVKFMEWAAFVLAGLLLVPTAYGQEATVEGTVTSAESGEPLPGVNVVVKGATIGTATDAQGGYSLSVPSLQDTLVFSFIGYETQEVLIAGRTEIDVALTQSVLRGEEVLVVGYTKQKRKSITGAVSTISADELSERKVATLGQALKGRMAGVSVATSGRPGGTAQIIIRGMSFLSGSSPLYIIDGMYVRETPNIDPSNVASIQVLKGPSATAQYGSQAANGVIVITTKEGQTGETRVSVGAYYGYQEIPTKMNLMEAQEWASLSRTAYRNAGEEPMESALHPEKYANTDWQAALFKPGAIQNYNLSISGGSSDATYLISGTYTHQEGAIIGPSFKRYNLRVNSEITKGIFTFGESIALSRYVRARMIQNPFIEVIRMLPTIPVYDSTTTSGFGFGSIAQYTFGQNPIGLQKMIDNTDTANQLLGTLFAEVALLDNLTYRFNLGIQFEDYNRTRFRQRGRLRLNNPLKPAALDITENDELRLLFENQLIFDDSFGTHDLQAVLGYTEVRRTFDHLWARREGYASYNRAIRVIDAGKGDLDNEGHKNKSTLHSFLVRAVYDYDDTYLFTGNFRVDGSSRFGEDNRYGSFWAASAGWALSEEAFYASIPVLSAYVDYFKVRAGYGVLGNQDIGYYTFLRTIAPNLSYVVGPGRVVPGAIQTALANPDIRWQANKQLNVGVDLRLFDNRLSITANYYENKSSGLLVRAPLPPSLGSEGAPFINAGTIKNTGFELGVRYNSYFSEDFQLNASANLTSIHNEVLQLGNGNQPLFAGPGGAARTAIGYPIGHFYLWKTDGLFQSEQEVEAHCAQPDADPGDIRYVDLNGDCIIDAEDRYVAGSPIPDFRAGFTLDARYKNFDFSLALRGVYGNEIYSVPKMWSSRLHGKTNLREGLDPWSPNDQAANAPRPITGPEGVMNRHALSERWLEDGSYLRIQNVAIGYTLPLSLMGHLGLGEGSLRVYANVQNLYTFTGYVGLDPTIQGGGVLAQGVDSWNTFPDVRTFTIGLTLDFGV